MIDREKYETALDTGRLFVAMQNGNWWKARRNGATKTWKTRPTEFRIPFKCGLRTCGALDHDTNPANFEIR